MSFKNARLKSGKTVAEVTKLFGITYAAVYQWEMGVNKPKTDKLLKLAEFYGCTVEELLKDD